MVLDVCYINVIIVSSKGYAIVGSDDKSVKIRIDLEVDCKELVGFREVYMGV